MNVVTLLPSATEIVYALGVEPVGVSHECDYPPAANEQPAVNYSHVDPDASSGEIDEQVLEARAEQGGVYGLHTDVLADLDPDLIVTQGMCDVCAVDSVLVEEAVEELNLDAAVLTTDPHSLEDVFEDIREIGAALDREDRAIELVADLRTRVAAVETTAARADERPRTLVMDWLEPPMVAGHWMPELVKRAGGIPVVNEPGDRSEPYEWATLRETEPDVLVAAPCGFGLAQIAENITELIDRDGWSSLPAVEADQAYAMDGHHYANRPGPRLVDTLEFLAGLLHPELFDAPPTDVAVPIETLASDTLEARHCN